MNRINILDKNTYNKIAAGEVVEKPYSVVKELIENSIDAQSKNISIEIKEGGQKLIKIIDDGYGIYHQDIEKAFLPHCTSKIKTIDDIYKINTMGFRGEALASIASVAKVKLTSKIKEDPFGKEISIEGGIKKYLKDAGCNVGTTIEVKDLFFNVPARRKFLKSTRTESAAISDIITRLSLAHNEISFNFFNEGNKKISTYATNDVSNSIRALYGKKVYENIIYLEGHSDIASVYGYIGNTEISRKSRNNQSIFVNKRYVKSPLIVAAAERAFKSFSTVSNFPFFVLFIEVYPEFIDVNVHPTKSEIKFSDDRGIFKLVFDSVHEALSKNLKDTFVVKLKDDVNTIDKNTDNNVENHLKENIQIKLPVDLKTNSLNNPSEFKYNDAKPEANLNDFEKIKDEKGYILNNEYKNKEEKVLNKNNFEKSINKLANVKELTKDNINNIFINESAVKNNAQELKYPKLPDINVIGQFNKTYILGEYQNELYIIDQHAAHEKVLFEKYKKEIINSNVACQMLITPVIIELSSMDFAIFEENKKIFNNAGFHIELFGEDTISIRQVPIIIGKSSVEQLFMEILNNLKNMGSGKTEEVKYLEIATLACKAAIKAHDSLSDIEMKALIEQLKYLDEPFNCPHGRPTIIKITLKELEKRFKRIE